jgi:hypothetical protein
VVSRRPPAHKEASDSADKTTEDEKLRHGDRVRAVQRTAEAPQVTESLLAVDLDLDRRLLRPHRMLTAINAAGANKISSPGIPMKITSAANCRTRE